VCSGWGAKLVFLLILSKCESVSENKKSELLALAPTLTLFVVPSGLPPSPFRLRTGKLLDLTGKKKNAGYSTGIVVVPSGLEPELF
jgi:hypothetical protein